MRNRWERLIKNSRWYHFQPGRIAKVGWGDLSHHDLLGVAAALEPGQAFMVLGEHPRGSTQHLPWHEPDDSPPGWCWYDRPDDPPGPAAADLVHAATYAVIDKEIRYVDLDGAANRAGNVWVSPGYRYTSTGRLISRSKVRFAAISPGQLIARLDKVVDKPGLRSVAGFDHPWR